MTSRNELSWGELEQQQVKQRAAPQSSYRSSSSNRRDDAARVQPWLRDEPLYPGLKQRLDEALARRATSDTS